MFVPEYDTLTATLQRKAKKVGHWAMARWMMKQGFQFKYAYFVIFGKMPQEKTRNSQSQPFKMGGVGKDINQGV